MFLFNTNILGLDVGIETLNPASITEVTLTLAPERITQVLLFGVASIP